MVLLAALRTFPLLFQPVALRILLKSLLLTLLLFVGLGAALWYGVHTLIAHFGWGGGFAEATATTLGVIILAWILFRAIALAIMSLFVDEVIILVEQRNYPEAAERAHRVSTVRAGQLAIKSLTRAVLANLLALPFLLLLLATGIGSIGLFLLVNAWLLGRDLADMVEPRHPDQLPISRMNRWSMGFLSAFLFLIPILNLLAPIWSAAIAVHMLHGRKQDQ